MVATSLNPILQTESGPLLAALQTLLAAKQIVSPEEIAERIRLTDAATPANGARMVAARLDRSRLPRADASGWRRGGGSHGHPDARPAPVGRARKCAGPASPGRLHAVFLLSAAVLGYPPFWFKSAAYRARAVRDPAGVLAEWRTFLPQGTRIRVVDSTADYRWMVLPLRPAETEGWTETALAALVKEGDMIGVTVPKSDR